MQELGKMLLSTVAAPSSYMRGMSSRGAAKTHGSSFNETFMRASGEAENSGEAVKGAEPRRRADPARQTADTAKTGNAADTQKPEADAIETDVEAEVTADVNPVTETEVDTEVDTEIVPPEDDAEIPDELAALAGTPYRPDILSPAPAEDTAASASAETTQVVSILESNTEIEAQITVQKGADTEIDPEVFKAAIAESETENSDEELTARMPQKAGQAYTPENTQQVTSRAVSDDDANAENSSPLENINNSTEIKTQTPHSKSGTDSESDRDDDNSLTSQQPKTLDITPERFTAAESMTKAATAPTQVTATPQTVMSTIIDNIEMTNTSESKFMEISLKPEFLGKVAIQLSLSDSGLEIRIKADDSGVKTLLAGQITQLTESLESKGVKVTGVDVVLTNVTDHAYSDGSGGQRGGYREPQPGSDSRIINVEFGYGFTESPEPVAVADSEHSSVEYTA